MSFTQVGLGAPLRSVRYGSADIARLRCYVDLKPENVLLDMAGPGGRVRLADFNAALYVTPGRALAGSEVYSRARVGSEPYIAWETSCGAWYGKAVDWWALGCLVFDMLFGSVSAPAPAFSSRSRSFAPLPCL